VEPQHVGTVLDRLRAERAAAGPRRVVPPRAVTPAAGQPSTSPVEVPDDPGSPGDVVAPEANPYTGRDRTPPAAARPPAADEPADEGQD
jgi:hypothetical protein